MPPPKMTPEERKMFEDAVADGLTLGAQDPVGLAQAQAEKWHGASTEVTKLFGDKAAKPAAGGDEKPSAADAE